MIVTQPHFPTETVNVAHTDFKLEILAWIENLCGFKRTIVVQTNRTYLAQSQ